jgi:hypothetical protein
MNGLLIIWLLIALVLAAAYVGYRNNLAVADCAVNRSFDERMFKGACIALPVIGLVLTLILVLI